MIIILGFATWTTLLSFRSQTTMPSPTALLPDAFMEDVNALIMDKQGKPNMKIVTPKLIHYAESDTTRFTMPQLTLYRKSPQPWYITSQYAKATQGTENVDFWENVVIQHAADQNNPSTVIKTTTLTVYPNKKMAETNRFITLIQPNIVVNAVGMLANMNTGEIKLLSQARGEYAPDS